MLLRRGVLGEGEGRGRVRGGEEGRGERGARQ